MTNITFQGGNLKRDCTKCAIENYNARFYAEGVWCRIVTPSTNSMQCHAMLDDVCSGNVAKTC